MFGLNMVVHKGRTIFVGDTSVHEYPTSEQMVEMAISSARVVRLFGFDPKVAFVSTRLLVNLLQAEQST